MEQYFVFQVSFWPEPIIQGALSNFNTLKEVEDFIENPSTTIYGQVWIIVKKPIVGNQYELVRCQSCRIK